MNKMTLFHEELRKRASTVTPGATHSFARIRVAEEGKRPLTFIKWARGCRFCDVEGNEYIDYHNAFGPILLGHAHPVINEAVKDRLENGTMHGMNHEIEVLLCEKIIEHVPCAEQVVLLTTGSCATSAALTIARTHTRKNKVVKFQGHYHGWHNQYRPGGAAMPDTTLWPQSGVPLSDLINTIVIPWNDLEIVEKVFQNQGNDIAAVICEPIMFNGPYAIYPDEGYLEGLKELTKEYNIVFILDEVICGFRLSIGGAQQVLGITPDMATFGKCLGGGFPIAAVAGSKKVMHHSTQVSGTYNSNPISTAAALATIHELEKPGVYDQLYEKSQYLMDGLREIIRRKGIDAVIQGPGPAFGFYFTEKGEIKGKDYFRRYQETGSGIQAARQIAFLSELWKRGIHFRPRVYLTLSHTKKYLDITLEAAEASFKEAEKIR